jgi:hypothetical protein
VIGFGAACTYSPAYSSASFTTSYHPSPLVLTNLPSSTIYTNMTAAAGISVDN